MYTSIATIFLLASKIVLAAPKPAASSTPTPVACGINVFQNPQFTSTANWILETDATTPGTVTSKIQSQYIPANGLDTSTYLLNFTLPAGKSESANLIQNVNFSPYMDFDEKFLFSIAGSADIACTVEFFAGQGDLFPKIGNLPKAAAATPGSYWGSIRGEAWGTGQESVRRVLGAQFVCKNTGAQQASVQLYLDQASAIGRC